MGARTLDRPPHAKRGVGKKKGESKILSNIGGPLGTEPGKRLLEGERKKVPTRKKKQAEKTDLLDRKLMF